MGVGVCVCGGGGGNGVNNSECGADGVCRVWVADDVV